MKYLRRALAALLLIAAVAWICDALLFRRRIARDEGYGAVTIHQRYAVHLKNKQLDYRSMKPYPQECVRALFPHEGESPCWYVEKNADRIDDVDSGQWHFWAQ